MRREPWRAAHRYRYHAGAGAAAPLSEAVRALPAGFAALAQPARRASPRHEHGVRRLEVPRDWVREEVRIALERGILLLPVLVDGAAMPRAEDLPEVIRALAERQAAEISDSRWDYDVGEIIKALERVVAVMLGSRSFSLSPMPPPYKPFLYYACINMRPGHHTSYPRTVGRLRQGAVTVGAEGPIGQSY